MKRKQILARAITLGLLLAMPCSAWAAELTINGDSLTDVQQAEGWAVVGAEIYNTNSVTNNRVTFLSGNLAYQTNINGAYEVKNRDSENILSSEMYGNVVEIKGGNAGVIHGAYSGNNFLGSQYDTATSGNVHDNTVNLKNGSVLSIIAGESCAYADKAKSGEVFNNVITITGGSMQASYNDIYAGKSYASGIEQAVSGDVYGNQVIIGNVADSYNGTIACNAIYAGYSESNGQKQAGSGSVYDNEIIIQNSTAEIKSTVIYGGYSKSSGEDATSGDVYNNKITIDSAKVVGNITAGKIEGANVENGKIHGNSVTVKNATVKDVRGGEVEANGNIYENQINISNSTAGNVYGGQSKEGVINSNKIIVDNSTVKNIYGGGKNNKSAATVTSNEIIVTGDKSKITSISGGQGQEVIENKITVNDGEIKNIYGGITSDGKVDGNEIFIAGGTITKNVVAGQVGDGGFATNNKIILAGSANLEQASLYGFKGKGTGSDNSLIIDGYKGSAKSANNFATVDLGEKEQSLAISEMNGDSTTFVVHDVQKNYLSIAQNKVQEVVVHGTSRVANSLNPDNLQESLQEVIDVIDVKDGNKQKRADIDPGVLMGRVQALSDENGNIVSYKEDVNPANEGISEMASIALMTWRQENNDMNKRLGELRDSAGEHGVWVRMTRGEAKYGNQNIKNQYNAYQLGYDEKLSVDKRWTVGAALTYTDAESSFGYGKGENKHKGLAVYGSRLNDDGCFIDLIARYARLEHDYEVHGGAGKGDFDTNGYSLSAEYGKRFTKENGLWIEPQVELTYGRVSSGSYLTNNGVRVQQDGMDSLVGRLGFALGKNLAQGKGNVYLRASYLYDFDGETDVRYSYNHQNKRFEQDLGGGWWEVGVGTNINLSDASHLYFDVEKTYGGDVATPWQWNAGVRWSF